MSDEPRPASQWIAYLTLTACGALLAILHNYRPRAGRLWLETSFNTLHVPVFAHVALVIFVALRLLGKLRFGRCIAVALIVAMLLSALSDVAQIQGPRDASVEDLVSDWLGSASAILLLMAAGRGIQISQSHRGTFAIGGFALGLLAMWPLMSDSPAYSERNRNLPVCLDFDAKPTKTFIGPQNSTLEVTVLPITKR